MCKSLLHLSTYSLEPIAKQHKTFNHPLKRLNQESNHYYLSKHFNSLVYFRFLFIISEILIIFAFDEGERILILPWAQAGCQIDLRDFRPGYRLAASTSCATVSDMVTKLCFSCVMMYNFALVSMSWTLPTSNSVSSSTLNCVQQTTKSVNRSRQHHH